MTTKADAAVAWLRAQIEGDKALAEKVCYDGSGMWWRRTGRYVSGQEYPTGALHDNGPGDSGKGEDDIGWIISDIVIYDEGRPSDEQFDHIMRHDPRNVVADCEAKLAIIDCDQVQLWTLTILARAYRHREGFAEHWGDTV